MNDIEKKAIAVLIDKIWSCYNEHSEEGYVTDEFDDFANHVENLTNYLINKYNLE